MRRVKKIIEVILIVIIIFCFGKVGIKHLEYNQAKEVYKNLERIEDEIEKDDVSEVEKLKKRYEKMKAVNEDYVFWIEIGNTNINYPVVKSLDNYDYLHKNFDKNKNSSGTIFVDYTNRMDDFNTIIHGHNMKNGTMFNNLVKFKEENFYKNNKEVIVYNKEEKETYEIFAVYVVEAEENFLRRQYSKDYIDFINKESIYKERKEISEKDKIITLSTCSYEYENARTVVHAVKKAS
ncbi:MAG: class B sortase [Clostridium sp.]|uniref:class B sortase n=1 Tax=Clostridium sp. TaxID=1506 RepID=UPI003EE5253F